VNRRTRRAFTIVELLAVILVVAILAGIAMVKYHDKTEQTKQARAMMDLHGLVLQLGVMDELPTSLAAIGRGDLVDPWGRPYEYLRFDDWQTGSPAGARKDRNLHPLNSRFDLYSKGPDGASNLPLTSGVSRDDIIVANDGKYVGIASGY
jgi:general secretion pathway protein G